MIQDAMREGTKMIDRGDDGAGWRLRWRGLRRYKVSAPKVVIVHDPRGCYKVERRLVRRRGAQVRCDIDVGLLDTVSDREVCRAQKVCRARELSMAMSALDLWIKQQKRSDRPRDQKGRQLFTGRGL